jgi:4-hydroxybenzoate polyprenyltransferase
VPDPPKEVSKLTQALRLVRIPNVFTVPGDPLAGAALAAAAGAEIAWGGPLLAAAAGSCIYLGGMAFNDVFDRTEDALERPGRPIPSGAIRVSEAVTLGALLHAAGLGLAFLAGPAVAVTAAVLVVATFAYNARAKAGPLGPFTMGLCRGLNLLMGALALAPLSPPPLIAAILLLAYVSVITVAARGEVGGAGGSAVTRAGVGFTAVLGAGVAVALTGKLPAHPLGLVPLLALAGVLGARIGALAREPTGARVGMLIKASVMGIVLFDASLAAAAGRAELACAIAALLIPALWLGKRFYST